ncbi:regulator of G protein signaling 19 isoform X2 [Silurus asotus]|uniref:Regulator of G-protein signaling 20 n=2 Tax=Silurus TaxID=94992 RepID=A0AAD5FEE3_SILAS|nr:regulator of G protein signaling 19 isoform X2 [Silurus asotus]
MLLHEQRAYLHSMQEINLMISSQACVQSAVRLELLLTNEKQRNHADILDQLQLNGIFQFNSFHCEIQEISVQYFELWKVTLVRLECLRVTDDGEVRSLRGDDMHVSRLLTTLRIVRLVGRRPPSHDGRSVPAERESPVARTEMSPSRAQHSPPAQRPNACCFCWCCCCSCSWREDESRRRLKAQDTKLETIPNCEVCNKPTVEEIKQWAQSFDKLMKNPAGRNVFREFLRTEYSEENMLFWLACEDLKKEINKSRIEEKARVIYEDYISILSPKEVSLDSRVREVINRKMQEPTSHTFEDAQLQIYTLMHRDSYPRFLNSPIYRSMVQGGSRSSSES